MRHWYGNTKSARETFDSMRNARRPPRDSSLKAKGKIANAVVCKLAHIPHQSLILYSSKPSVWIVLDLVHDPDLALTLSSGSLVLLRLLGGLLWRGRSVVLSPGPVTTDVPLLRNLWRLLRLRDTIRWDCDAKCSTGRRLLRRALWCRFCLLLSCCSRVGRDHLVRIRVRSKWWS